MCEFLEIKSYLIQRQLCQPEDLVGATDEEILKIDELLGEYSLPDEFKAFYRCVGHGAGEELTTAYAFTIDSIQKNNADFVEDFPDISRQPFKDVFVVVSYYNGYCYFNLEESTDKPAKIPFYLADVNLDKPRKYEDFIEFLWIIIKDYCA